MPGINIYAITKVIPTLTTFGVPFGKNIGTNMKKEKILIDTKIKAVKYNVFINLFLSNYTLQQCSLCYMGYISKHSLGKSY